MQNALRHWKARAKELTSSKRGFERDCLVEAVELIDRFLADMRQPDFDRVKRAPDMYRIVVLLGLGGLWLEGLNDRRH